MLKDTKTERVQKLNVKSTSRDAFKFVICISVTRVCGNCYCTIVVAAKMYTKRTRTESHVSLCSLRFDGSEKMQSSGMLKLAHSTNACNAKEGAE